MLVLAQDQTPSYMKSFCLLKTIPLELHPYPGITERQVQLQGLIYWQVLLRLTDVAHWVLRFLVWFRPFRSLVTNSFSVTSFLNGAYHSSKGWAQF